MSYIQAKQCFDENRALINSQSAPLAYNLNTGLSNLADALESDLSQVKNLLSRILQALERR
jgi:hypothetical protein